MLFEKLLTRVLRSRLITREDDPYLSRWFLFRTKHLRVFVHKFHRSDWDEELHNHPWKWAMALILRGGYSEERRVRDLVVRRECRPGSLNFIKNDTFHRVDLYDSTCWTLFVAGRKTADWGFWDRVTGKFVPWREHVEKTGAYAAE